MSESDCAPKLHEIYSEVVGFPFHQKLFPGCLFLGIACHATQHAAQRGFYTFGDLGMWLTGGNAVDECALFVAIREFKIVQEAAICGELTRSGCCCGRLLPLPCDSTGDFI